MIKIINRTALVLIVNNLSLLLVFLIFELALRFGVVPMESPDLATLYFFQTYATLIICAVFSLSFVFLNSQWRYVFLLAPLVIPAAYGIFFLMKHQVS